MWFLQGWHVSLQLVYNWSFNHHQSTNFEIGRTDLFCHVFQNNKLEFIITLPEDPGCRRAFGLTPQERAWGAQPPPRLLQAQQLSGWLFVSVSREAPPDTRDGHNTRTKCTTESNQFVLSCFSEQQKFITTLPEDPGCCRAFGLTPQERGWGAQPPPGSGLSGWLLVLSSLRSTSWYSRTNLFCDVFQNNKHSPKLPACKSSN
jgi:hypothetical protein